MRDVAGFWPRHAGPGRWCGEAAWRGPRAGQGGQGWAPRSVHQRPGPLPGVPSQEVDEAPPCHRLLWRLRGHACRGGGWQGIPTCTAWRGRGRLRGRTCPRCTGRGPWRGTAGGSGSEETRQGHSGLSGFVVLLPACPPPSFLPQQGLRAALPRAPPCRGSSSRARGQGCLWPCPVPSGWPADQQ